MSNHNEIKFHLLIIIMSLDWLHVGLLYEDIFIHAYMQSMVLRNSSSFHLSTPVSLHFMKVISTFICTNVLGTYVKSIIHMFSYAHTYVIWWYDGMLQSTAWNSHKDLAGSVVWDVRT